MGKERTNYTRFSKETIEEPKESLEEVIESLEEEPEKVEKIVDKILKVKEGIQLNVRKGPGLEEEILKVLNGGDKVKFMEIHGDWTKVVYENGKNGYVLSEFVEEA